MKGEAKWRQIYSYIHSYGAVERAYDVEEKQQARKQEIGV